MTATGKPTIFPILRYTQVHTALDWLTEAFGFVRQAEYAHDQSIHAELRYGAGVLAVADRQEGADGLPSITQSLYVRVDDVDRHHARAVAAGAEIARAPHDTAYGTREYVARDGEANLWVFGTYDMGAGDGDQTFFPELRYRDAVAARDWLVRAFGLERGVEIAGPGGTIAHGELRFGDSAIMIGSRSPGSGEFAEIRQFVNVHVEDPDAHFARAKAAGAAIVMPPRTTPFGARFYAARDPEGFLWWLSTYKPVPLARAV
jgi:uncharacterized glyoxalase superfamily protein PhnB